MIEGIDFATGELNLRDFKKSGKKFVARYLAPDTASNRWKHLTAHEVRRYREAGVDVVTVFESSANRALDGFAAGRVDALRSVEHLRAVGGPKDAVVYFAVDFDAREDQQDRINAYLRGAASVLGKGRVGVYAGYYPLRRALDAGVCAWGWQTYAWSGGRWDARAQLQQYSNGHRLYGVSCDLTRATRPRYGQWRRPVAVKWVRALVPRWVATKWAKRRAAGL